MSREDEIKKLSKLLLVMRDSGEILSSIGFAERLYDAGYRHSDTSKLKVLSEEEINTIKTANYPLVGKNSLELAIAQAQLVADKRALTEG